MLPYETATVLFSFSLREKICALAAVKKITPALPPPAPAQRRRGCIRTQSLPLPLSWLSPPFDKCRQVPHPQSTDDNYRKYTRPPAPCASAAPPRGRNHLPYRPIAFCAPLPRSGLAEVPQKSIFAKSADIRTVKYRLSGL